MPILGSFGAGAARGLGLTSGGGNPVDVDYLVIAGGGAGFNKSGGGAGGQRTSFPGGTKITLKGGDNTITVGAGGSGASQPYSGATRGEDSSTETDSGTPFLASAGGCLNPPQATPPGGPGGNPKGAAGS